ncbi:hypothetical protein [Streptomyces sp. NPDC050560]|uniref:hypothetical protein n=1 Tax=Streptomyces sp. NPDC050560 TaxID=3365630 RepID=UPI0037AC7061
MHARYVFPVRPLSTGAAVLLGAAVLSGCGYFGQPEASTADVSAPAASHTAPAPPPSSSPVPHDGLDGSWLATTEGKAVALVVGGKHAGLFQTDGASCQGATAEAEREESGGGAAKKVKTISLACSDGGDGRDHGMVESVTATSLKIRWAGRGEETFRRAGDTTTLPSGLPSAPPS